MAARRGSGQYAGPPLWGSRGGGAARAVVSPPRTLPAARRPGTRPGGRGWGRDGSDGLAGAVAGGARFSPKAPGCSGSAGEERAGEGGWRTSWVLPLLPASQRSDEPEVERREVENQGWDQGSEAVPALTSVAAQVGEGVRTAGHGVTVC